MFKIKVLSVLVSSVFLLNFIPTEVSAHTRGSHSSALIAAAHVEIDPSRSNPDKRTECSIYVGRVMKRAGIGIPNIISNNFHNLMRENLPNWSFKEFSFESNVNGGASLRTFLNSFPDRTAILAQWQRVGRGGHVALVVKVATDKFLIYQAQSNLALPHVKPVTISGLLYDKGRTNLRLFYE